MAVNIDKLRSIAGQLKELADEAKMTIDILVCNDTPKIRPVIFLHDGAAKDDDYYSDVQIKHVKNYSREELKEIDRQTYERLKEEFS